MYRTFTGGIQGDIEGVDNIYIYIYIYRTKNGGCCIVWVAENPTASWIIPPK